jgi:hypothetical protein
MQTKYAPKPGTARCPHCRASVPGVMGPGPAILMWLRIACPACGTRWGEVREAGERPIRFWTPVTPEPPPPA